MRNELPGRGARRSDAQTVYHVVQTALEQLEQVLARDASQTGGRLVGPVKLLLLYSVDGFGLLLLKQLGPVLRDLLALTGKSVLSRGIVLLLQ